MVGESVERLDDSGDLSRDRVTVANTAESVSEPSVEAGAEEKKADVADPYNRIQEQLPLEEEEEEAAGDAECGPYRYYGHNHDPP